MVFTFLQFRLMGKYASSSTTPMSSLASANSGLLLSMPSTSMLPESGSMAFIMSFMVVDLPAPFSPMRPIMLPSGRLRVRLSSVKSRYVFDTPLMSIAFFICFPPNTTFVIFIYYSCSISLSNQTTSPINAIPRI